MMRRIFNAWKVLGLVVVLAGAAAAQNTTRMLGTVEDADGKPYPDVVVELRHEDTNQTFTTKTDKAGKFVQVGLPPGIYTITLTAKGLASPYKERYQVKLESDNTYDANFKDIIAKQTPVASEDAKKKAEEEKSKFEGMKAHFQAGVAAMTDATAVRAQLKATPTDQQLKDKLTADYQTAATEFQAAEQAADPKDIANHATILGNLGLADEDLGKNEDAVAALQKAIDLKPTTALYISLATNLAKAGKPVADASAACNQAITLDPASAGPCWRNVGIVYSNHGDMQSAIEPLQKATQADPKNPEGWYLLGQALLNTMSSKKEGDKIVAVVQPGTAEAFQKYLEIAPTGSHAQEAKDALGAIASLQEGTEAKVTKKKK
ncbi:MAG TPA: carboxypeptidase regulatory-like domain-containing protein [Candidatus Acidoferrales bacterium]|jgi:tetratricopeptide (TPR) repeat protein|nr:carboxypeptidase regulatory-like domain-containing protein [Candidatus Acidoferrales bacterium]